MHHPLVVSLSCHAALLPSRRASWLLYHLLSSSIVGIGRRILRCRHRRAANKLLPTLRFCAAATTTAAALLPPRCRRCAVHRHCAAVSAAPLPSCRQHCAVALPPPPLPPLPRRCLLIGCCIVVLHPILSLHAVMQPSILSLPAALADNCLPPPPPPLRPGRHHGHRHNRGQTHHRTLTKKEAAAAAPPAYQLPHHCENICKSRQLGLI